MKKTYRIKATKRAWLDITADGSLSQEEIYNLAKEKAKDNKLQWEEPSFNIIDIQIDDKITETVSSKVSFMKPVDPLVNPIKES
jgi:hypothetical protein